MKKDSFLILHIAEKATNVNVSLSHVREALSASDISPEFSDVQYRAMQINLGMIDLRDWPMGSDKIRTE